MYKDKATKIAELLDIKGEAYASPDVFFEQLANTWNGMLGADLTPSQCCAMMLAFKACRIVNNPNHQDSADDMVGYSLILTELVKAPKHD